MKRHKVLVCGLLASLLAVTAKPLEAKEPTRSEREVARELVREAAKEIKKGNCEDALLLLEQAIAIAPTADAHAAFGECLTKRGELMRALENLEKAEDLARTAHDQGALKALTPKIAALRERLPRIAIELPADVKNPRISVDSKPIDADKAERLITVDPGDHLIEVVVDGRGTFVSHAMAVEQEVTKVTVVLPAATATSSGAGTGIPTGSFIAGGAAATLAIGGVVSFVLAGSTASDGEAGCATARTCSDASIDAVHDLDSAALGLWIAAGVSAGVAVGLWALNDGDKPASTGALRVGPGGITLAATY